MRFLGKELKWMEFAEKGAQIFSTCGKKQYFAFILNQEGHVLGQGYNGSPKGYPHCVDGGCPRLLNNSPSGSVYDDCVSCHAEANAIVHSNTDERKGAILIVNGPPCWDCAKLIANSGIGRVVYKPDPDYKDWPRVARFLAKCGVFAVSVEQNGASQQE